MVGFRTKAVTTEPLLAKKEERSQELFNTELRLFVARPYLETITSKSVTSQGRCSSHFLKKADQENLKVSSLNCAVIPLFFGQ